MIYTFKKQNMLILGAIFSVLLSSVATLAQGKGSIPYKSQEVTVSDGVPVIIKHLPPLPEGEPQATFTNSSAGLKVVLGERPVIDHIDFAGGTEAVTAAYPAGKLLIVEFTTPQASIDADNRIKAVLNGDPATIYRRIGNYNAFVFDTVDAEAANALLDQVKYEKTVQWLGPNPYQISPERAFVIGTSDLFISTVLIVVLGLGFSLVAGAIGGYVYFLVRERRRGRMATFTDAGGMIRLNLDGFTPDILPKGLLKD